MAISSDELNYLVYRYLQESGFSHSAFLFACESLVAKANIHGSDVPPGALVSFVQKGLQYIEIETSITEDGNEVAVPNQPANSLLHWHTACASDNMVQDGESGDPTEVSEGKVATLSGHGNEVFVAAWHPKEDVLASGAGDGTTRLWRLPAGDCTLETAVHTVSAVLDQAMAGSDHRDVTALEWSPDGETLASGSFDGQLRLWAQDGYFKRNLHPHRAAIVALRFNKLGNMLLSCSIDGTVAAIDPTNGQIKRKLNNHDGPVLDADWRTSDSFASCSTDKRINVEQIGRDKPLRTFSGHTGEVNCVRWDPTGTLLASGSDDGTARVWTLAGDEALQTLSGHSKQVYTLAWAPGPGKSSGSEKLLATGSFDHSVRVWDAMTGEQKHCFEHHSEAVYTLAFSPDGELLASGSFDRSVYIIRVKDGQLIATLKNRGGVYDLKWNHDGSKLAVCCSDNTVRVITVNA